MSAATGTAPAFVAVSSTVRVLCKASQDDVESIKIILLAALSSCVRFIIGVTTKTTQNWPSSTSVVKIFQ